MTPFLLFSKGRKHYLTITFNDGADLVGAVELRLDEEASQRGEAPGGLDLGSTTISFSIEWRLTTWRVTIEGQSPVVIADYDSFAETLTAGHDLFSAAFPEHRCTDKCRTIGWPATSGQGLSGSPQ